MKTVPISPQDTQCRKSESATRQGAQALGFDQDYGTIEPGKSGRLLAVTIPADTIDVEEYLVGGVEQSQIRWIGES